MLNPVPQTPLTPARMPVLQGGSSSIRRHEYVISRFWRDTRVQRIYGGTNEIMYEIVGRSLGL